MNYIQDFPIYMQIATDIQEKIISGELQDGQKLSSVREYSIVYNVSALTMQRSIQYLESQKIVRTQKGVGSFVTENCREQIFSRMIDQEAHEFVERMIKRGMTSNQIIQLVTEVLAHE